MIDACIEEYGKRLYYLCLKLERDPHRAEELYQETWLKVLKGIDSYDPKQPFYPWLTKSCVNVYRSLLRKRAVEHLFSDFASSERKEFILDHAEYRQEDPVREDLLAALKNLDPRKRLIVVLHYYEGYTTKEIAVLAGIKEGTVKSRLHAARIELRRELEE
ncbi:MAG: RNA polymerase sigma factor [Clostridia bacterium]|nr:RNA polymerase sigma factor [Clostridia bacterium]